jgi:hypothetical protein
MRSLRNDTYNAKDFYGQVRYDPINKLKSMTQQYDHFTDFDERVDQDSRIGQDWKPMKVSRSILGLSDSRELSKDMEFATSNEDEYEQSENYNLWQTFRGANERVDEDSNPAEDYASALMQRTRYTNNDNEDCMGDKNSMDVAARFDRGRRRFPFEVNPLKYDVSADFFDNNFEEPIRSCGRVPRSNVARMPCIGAPQRYTMPKKLPIGNPLFEASIGQRYDPRENDAPGTARNSVFRRPRPLCGPVKPQVSNGPRRMTCDRRPVTQNIYNRVPSGGKIDWNSFDNVVDQRLSNRKR